MATLRGLLRDLALFERSFDDWGRLRCLDKLARRAADEGYGSPVIRVCRAGLRIAATDGERGEIYGRVAEVLLRREHCLWAARAYQLAASCFARSGQPGRAGAASIAQAVAEGLFDPARARLRLLGLSREFGACHLVERGALLSEVWLLLGELDLRQNRAEAALVCADFAARLLALDGRDENGRLSSLRGRALALLGRRDEAGAALATAVERFVSAGASGFEQASVLESLAMLRLDAGLGAEARTHLKLAIEVTAQLGDVEREARLEMLMASSWFGENDAEMMRHALLSAHRLARMASAPPHLIRLLVELSDLIPRRGLREAIDKCLSRFAAPVAHHPSSK